MEAEKTGGLKKSVIEWLESIVFAIAVIVCLFTIVFRSVEVIGESMVPNFRPGDKVVVYNFAQNFEMGDVVIVEGILPDPIIKRIIATEGQVVDFSDEDFTVSVDGVVVDDAAFGINTNITQKVLLGEPLDYPYVIPEGCVFVLGDNRPNSRDSRDPSVGPIDEKRVLGKVLFKFFPFDLTI